MAFIQNHDQIGNRAFGDRLGQNASPEAMRALAACYLLLPQTPMLFMGEEWGANQPFPFFCDFSGELADAVRNGRRAEFARFPEFQDPANRERIPDPLAESTFTSAKLDWSAVDPVRLAHYTALISARREHIVPLLPAITEAGTAAPRGPGAALATWRVDPTRVLTLAVNLSADRIDVPPAQGQLIWSEGDTSSALGAWSVRWSLEAA